ncbi:SusC/RagA family TonB-linked outer membrane protein [Chitinophaga sp. LS1]|uniref:SusC/RagA family TonB-linked outer membrane protein n=1 Tax=Chitinophaga sp. LS1 TaxID=3051176 RepID=UPI002AAC2026|nr:SusC/RagA family TonB-linked outer membrane protein [Chitinophaga sp. LS1]WPV67850.1 SusC/RagA family TonB-linked outer membrane protein [Chitinophaga sp. LS1]
MPVFITKNQPFSIMCIPTPCGTIVARILLYVFIINACMFQSAQAHQQEGKQKVTIVGNDISMDNVLKQIEKQTGLRFMYAAGALNLNEKIKAAFQQVQLDDVLSSILGSKGVIWQYRDGTILLKQQFKGKSDDNVLGESKLLNSKMEVAGRILDTNGSPIPSATIIVKGTKKGTKSDADGYFRLSDVESGDVLLVTSIGFETKELVVNDDAQLIVKLRIAIGALDEAVVIAYGSTTGRTLTGNVSTIKGEEIARSPVTNPLMAISGRVPGIMIDQKNGFSGSAVTTLVQGQNSILKGNDPFYVIDGVPYPSQNLSITATVLGVGGYNTQSKGSTLSFINPADIESITVLKDADATAIYGSRAANGAILITTKRGKQGKTKVTIDYQQGGGKVARHLDLMSTTEYLAMRHEAKLNDKIAVGATDYDVNGFWDSTRNVNWQKELIGKTAKYMNVNGSISGGNNNIQYLIGGTFHRETTVLPTNFNDQKGSVHFNITSNSNDNKFQMQFSGSYLVDNNKLPNVDFTNYAVTLAPDAPPLYNADGTINFMPNASGASTFNNPLIQLNQKININTENLVSNLLLGYTIMPGLNLKTSLGYTNMHSNEIMQVPLSTYIPEIQQYLDRFGVYGNYAINTWIIEPQLTYDRSFGFNKFNFLLGSSLQQNNSKGNEVFGSGFNSDQAIGDINSATTLISTGSIMSVYKYAGLFGRVTYAYNNKYIVNLSARRDGSSRFGSANRFHNFGAIGLGWIFSSEDFMKNNLPALSYGKLRFSYGTTGNDQIGDYATLNLYSPLVVGVPYRGISSLVSNGINNPYLQWEETKKVNFGLDLGFIKDKILLNANYYINRSSNQLLPYKLPSIAGVSNITTNYPATVQNSGWEFTVTSTVIKRSKFDWNVNFNLTIPRNKLIAFKNLSSSSYANSLIVGQPLTITKVFHSLGVNPETGLYQFTDAKGAITSTPKFVTDQQTAVNLSPKLYAGLNTTFSYMGISLSALFQYMSRNGANYFAGAPYPGSFNQNQPKYLLDRWQKVNDNAAHQRFNSNNLLAINYIYSVASDASYSDASYCRLKNLSLSWDLPENWLKRAKISNLRLYAQGQNLLTFTNYKGLDPESLSSITLPPLKTFVFGVQLGL